MQLAENDFFLTSSRDIKEICKSLRKLAISHFAFSRSYKDGRRIYLGTSDAWLSDYFKNSFYLIGNCEHSPQYYESQTLLWSTLPNQIIYDQMRVHGMNEGIFIVNPQQTYTEFYDFSTNMSGINIVNIFMTHQEYLKNFIVHFKERARLLIEQGEKNNFILPHQSSQIPFSLQLDKPEKLIFHNGQKELSEKQIKLTKRQLDCAAELLKGKSYKEIAHTFSLSPRTVETYFNNLKIKFGVQNRTQLILELGKLNPNKIPP